MLPLAIYCSNMENKAPNKKWGWLIFVTLVIVVIQFFWVMKTYYMLESGKVIRWMLTYFSIPCLVGSFFLLKQFNRHLFYAYPERYSETNLSKLSRFKNKLTSYVLIVALFSFFTYDTIIQTNDWFGTSERMTFNQRVEGVEYVHHGGRSRRFSGKGFYTSNIRFIYKGKERIIRANGKWNEGDTLKITLNTGGFWGIFYTKSLL